MHTKPDSTSIRTALTFGSLIVASCVPETGPRAAKAPSDGLQAHRSQSRARARVRVAGRVACDGCSLEELGARLRVRPRPLLPPNDLSWPLAPADYSDREGRSAMYRLVLKFMDGARVRATPAGEVYSLRDAELDAVETLRKRYGVHFAPVIDTPPEELDALTIRAMRRSLQAQPDMAGLLALDIPAHQRDRMVEVGLAFQALDLVEFAEIEFLNPPSPTDYPPPTPDFSDMQGYLGPDPGIDAPYAWELGYFGQGVKTADSEYDWWLDHEEFDEIDVLVEPGQQLNGNSAHGTAVIGVTSAQHNGYGVDGICPDALPMTVYPEGGGRRVAAVTNMVAQHDPGDAVMLEQQVTGAGGGYGPAELSNGVWMASKMGSDAGVIVIGAAGNGSQDLDSEPYRSYMDRGDSGALIIGAGRGDTEHAALGFSTYGSRVNVQGWGSGVMTASTYGTIFDGDGDERRQSYGRSFNGTSSATPIATGAAVLIQSYVKDKLGRPLTPMEMRALLIETGIPAGGNRHIGPLPNVRAAIESIELPDDEAPEVQIVDPDMDLDVDESPFELRVEVEATDNAAVTGVRLEVNGADTGEVDEEPPYLFDLELEEGEHEIIAVAVDPTDNEGRSEALRVTVEVSDDDAEESSTDAEGESDGDDASGDGDGDADADDDTEDGDGDGADDGDGSGDDGSSDDDDDDDDSDDEPGLGDDGESTGVPDASTDAEGCNARGSRSSFASLVMLFGLSFARRLVRRP